MLAVNQTRSSKGLNELKEIVFDHYPKASVEWALIEKAYHFALKAHGVQRRQSGEMFIIHPLGVARILADMGLDAITIAAGLLHDVVEDTEVGLEEIEQEFDREIALLVDGVTKLGRVEFTSKEEQQAETLRKMFIAMAKDIRVILIKLADRTHNLRTLRYLKTFKQKEIAQETLEIYAPLAHRLGIYKIKWELEDLAFRYKNGAQYYELADKLDKNRRERERFISRIMDTLREQLEQVGLGGELQGRPKHLYSIYNKIREQNLQFSEIYDLTGIRVIVDNIKDCYGALGVVHTLWRPIPGRFKDYIAMPKPNMYQSLHTTVVAAENELVEIQIRTWEMHRTAEYGIAAHWRYKEKITNPQELDQKLAWLRQLLEWQHEYRDPREFMESLKIDLFLDEVFVFTPRGDVISLPKGSGPLDFAYKIHTDIGHRCTGARVNGRIVSLDYQLKTGEIVEIITGKTGAPSRDWLNLVKTPSAKNRIRSWFKKERREENIEKGRELLERELKRLNLDHQVRLTTDLLEAVGKKFNLLGADDVYASVGYGGTSARQVAGRLCEEYAKKHGKEKEPVLPETRPTKRETYSESGVKIQGMDNLLLRMARCCLPVPGDKITGFITKGRGVSIHRANCPNLKNAPAERLVEATWDRESQLSYPVEIAVRAIDRPSLLADVVAQLSESKVNIMAVDGKADRGRAALIHLTLAIQDRTQLQRIMNQLKRVKDVLSVKRRLAGRQDRQ